MREGERVVSLLDAYSLVSSPSYGCSWDDFQAYSYLKKLGYVVGRHNFPWTSPKNRPPGLPTDIANLSSQLAAVKLLNTGHIEDLTCGRDIEDSLESSSVNSSRVDIVKQGEKEENSGESVWHILLNHLQGGKVLGVVLGFRLVLKCHLFNNQALVATGHISKQDDDTTVVNLKLMYDVHLPNSRFKKTNPGCPAFSLCITRFGENLFVPAPTFSMQDLFTLYMLGLNVISDLFLHSNRPPCREAVRALEGCCKGRPVKFAAVVCDHVSIYSFEAVALHALP